MSGRGSVQGSAGGGGGITFNVLYARQEIRVPSAVMRQLDERYPSGEEDQCVCVRDIRPYS